MPEQASSGSQRSSMWASRVMVWPVAGLSYASLLVAAAHWLTDTWSGLATLGLFFAVVFGAPALAGYAGYLWRKNLLRGNTRWEALACGAFPLLLLGLGVTVISLGRVSW